MGAADHRSATPASSRVTESPNDLLRGTVWGFRYLEADTPRPVVIVSNDGRNRSRFAWVHIVRITSRPKRPLPTIVELADADAPLTGRAMADELELVHKDDLGERRGMLSPATMGAIDQAFRHVLALD